MITVAGDGCCKIWDLLNGICLWTQPCLTNWLMTCDNYWINTDYSLASSGGLDNIVTIYPISLRSFTSSSSLLNIKDKIELSGHDGYVGCARFTNEGQSIVSGSGDQTVRLWDIENKKEIWKNEESGGDVLVVAPITNETYLAAGVDKKIHFLDSRQKSTNLQVFSSHDKDINALSLSADQTQFASASDDGTCRLWDIRTGTERKKFEICNDSLTSVVLSGTVQTVYCGSSIGNLYVTDITNNVLKQNITDHHSRISCLHKSNDGRVLISGSWDLSVNIWSHVDV